MPMPALITEGKTSTAADLLSSSREPLMWASNWYSVSRTSASIWAPDLASAGNVDPATARVEQSESESASRRLIAMVFPEFGGKVQATQSDVHAKIRA